MTRISVTGPKKYLEDVIDTFYDLGILDIDSYEGELEKGDPLEGAEELSQLLVDARSLLSKLPDTEETGSASIEEVQERIPEVSEDVDRLIAKKEGRKRELSTLKEEEKFYRRLQSTGLRYEDLKGTEKLGVFIGKVDREELSKAERYEIIEGESASAVVYEKDSDAEDALLEARKTEYSLPDRERKGRVEDILDDIQKERNEIQEKVEDTERKLQKLADEWRPKVEDVENYLAERVEKAEAPLDFATTDSAFIAQGWIPSKDYDRFEEQVADVTDGKVHIEREEGDNPPVKHENPAIVQPFEPLTDLVSVPRYNELDPSFMIFLTFPLFFGFMIGDAGYGLTTLAVFYLGYRMFPQAKDIFVSLMYASVFTILFGLAFGDAFGFMIFGEHSKLAQVTGIHLFSEIPVLFHRAEHLGKVFKVSALMGLVHVNMGYLLGAYNEYVRHGLKEAFLEKGSWMLLEAGAGLWYFLGAAAGAPVMAISLVTLYLGEGIEGLVEIPSLLSNILSYLRIFGVAVAAVSLAAVVDSLALPLFRGGVLGIVLGTLVLVIGHVFNTFIKIIEGFLQGIRLHYVELFMKFFEGGGRRYEPFGSEIDT
ncbi:MAG: V-type ATP synthase subunit I [Candidatus Nanohaloarchaea archaeon]